MHSSFLTILAAGSFYLTTSSAAPAPASTPGTHATVKYLDSNNMIHWTPTPGGGSTAKIAPGLIDHAHQQLSNGASKVKPRDISTQVGSWTNIGEIADYAAKYACEGGGTEGVSSNIATTATDACTKLVAMVPGTEVAETAWNVYQTGAQAGAGGGNVNTLIRWFTNTEKAPTLTQTICTTAITDLTSVFCQGKGKDGGNTYGGEIKIGTGDDFLAFGIDPGPA